MEQGHQGALLCGPDGPGPHSWEGRGRQRSLQQRVAGHRGTMTLEGGRRKTCGGHGSVMGDMPDGIEERKNIVEFRGIW